MPNQGLLSGLNVLDITDENGAYATKLLADLGASVVRLIPSSGDPLMRIPPTHEESGISFFYEFMNLNKRSVFLDLENPDSDALLRDAARWAQIVVVSLDELFPGKELVPESIVPLNEARVWVTVRSFGNRADSYSKWTMDDLLFQAAGGLLALSGSPEREPLKLYGRQTAYIAGIHAAGAALISYFDAQRRAQLRTVELSIQAAVMHTLETAIQFYTTRQEVRSRRGASGQAGDGTFRAKDGLVVLACITEPTWEQLLQWLDGEGVAHVSDMRDWDPVRRRKADAIQLFRSTFEAFSRELTRQQLYRRAQAAGVVLSPVNGVSDLFTDAQLLFERWFTSAPLANWGLVPFPGPPYRIGCAPIGIRTMAPSPGADSAAFWSELENRAPAQPRRQA